MDKNEIHFYEIISSAAASLGFSCLESYDYNKIETGWGIGDDFKNSVYNMFEKSKAEFKEETDKYISRNNFRKTIKISEIENKLEITIDTFKINEDLFKRYIQTKDDNKEKIESEILKIIHDFIFEEKKDERLEAIESNYKSFKYKEE